MILPRISEKAIQTAVIDHWRALGTPGSYVAAIPQARAFGQPGLTKGIFDLLVMSPTLGVAFMELKTETGRLSPDQAAIYRRALRMRHSTRGLPRA